MNMIEGIFGGGLGGSAQEAARQEKYNAMHARGISASSAAWSIREQQMAGASFVKEQMDKRKTIDNMKRAEVVDKERLLK